MHTNQNTNTPYPERDTVADAPLVVEPITEFAERVWHGPRSFDFFLRWTEAYRVREAMNLAAAWRDVRPVSVGPIGSRFD
jgi:hypothetical protein